MLKVFFFFWFLSCFTAALAHKPASISEEDCQDSVLSDRRDITRLFLPVKDSKRSGVSVAFSEDSAPAVFLEFMQTHLGENWREQIRRLRNQPHQKDWEELIVLYSKNLKPVAARDLLFLLTEQIGVAGTIEVIAKASFFKEVEDFMENSGQ